MGKIGEDEMRDTGVIAQELREVLPDAVRETGDLELSSGVIEGLLGVNKVRSGLCVQYMYIAYFRQVIIMIMFL